MRIGICTPHSDIDLRRKSVIYVFRRVKQASPVIYFLRKYCRKRFCCKFLQQNLLLFNHHEVIPQYAPLGIYHIASAIFHISGGNISFSRQGKHHWRIRKSLSASAFWWGGFSLRFRRMLFVVDNSCRAVHGMLAGINCQFAENDMIS